VLVAVGAVYVAMRLTGAQATRKTSAAAAPQVPAAPVSELPTEPSAVPSDAGPAALPSPVPSSAAPGQPTAAPPKAPGDGWALRWSPSAARDGLAAFEGVEDDRAKSEPGVKHIYVADGHFRVDMNMRIRDSSPDRQRNEVKGMHAGNTDLALGLGETWRLSWSLFIPDSLRATTTFTHIMQLKMPGNGTSPIVTMSLRRVGGVPKIELQVNQSGTIVGRADLTPLQNKWIDTTVEFQIGDAGSVHWTLASGGTTVLDASRSGVDLWLQDRVRPKWGIYRSLGDTSGALRDCFLLLDNMRAYQKQ
jgi:chitin-binding protein